MHKVLLYACAHGVKSEISQSEISIDTESVSTSGSEMSIGLDLDWTVSGL